MSLSQFEETVGHWRGAGGSPLAEAGNHGGLAVAEVEAAGKRVPRPEMLCKRCRRFARVQAFRRTRERKWAIIF